MIAPEGKILILNAAVLGVAYFGIYPSMRQKTLGAMMRNDAILSLLVLLVTALLFAGSGIRFNMILFDSNWFIFSLVVGMVMEIPLFLWFCRRHDIDLTGERP